MGLMMVISTLFEIVVMPTDLGPMKAFLPPDDRGLKRELMRAFLNYLGLKTSGKIATSQLTAHRRFP